jgi:Polyketide cyclase / dehydrase and lipid transport
VWKTIADYSFDLEWRNGLTEMTPDPPGGPEPGTKVHEVVHNMGRDYVADTVVTEVDPGTSYRFSGEGTIGGVAGGRSVRPDGTGAVFTYEIELTPRGHAAARSTARADGPFGAEEGPRQAEAAARGRAVAGP